MILAQSATRLVFYPEGLAATGIVMAVVGGAAFVAVLVHGFIRAAGRGTDATGAAGTGGDEAAATIDPILPMWQVVAGLALAALVFLMAWSAVGATDWAVQLALMAVLAIACGVWVLFFYLRVFRWLGRVPMAVLLGLRILAILLLVLLIFKPVLSFEETLEHRTDLHILVDASRSMSVSDYPDSPHRMSLAVRQVKDYLDRLNRAFQVHLHWFDTRAHDAEPETWPDPKGEATNIARGVKDVLASARRLDTTALILMTDGLHNAGGDPVRAITDLGPPPVYTVGVGTDLTAQSGYQDVSIENVRAPEESTVNNVARMTVDVEAIGLADRMVQVELREKDKPLAQAPLRLDGNRGTQAVDLAFTPEETGRHTYTEWEPILKHRGSHHPALDPFKMPRNRRCRMNYSKDMCPRSLDILARTVMISLHPDRKADQIKALVAKIRSAAAAVLETPAEPAKPPAKPARPPRGPRRRRA